MQRISRRIHGGVVPLSSTRNAAAQRKKMSPCVSVSLCWDRKNCWGLKERARVPCVGGTNFPPIDIAHFGDRVVEHQRVEIHRTFRNQRGKFVARDARDRVSLAVLGLSLLH